MMSMLLFYFIIVLFLFYTYKNNKPIKWNEFLNALTFNQNTRPIDDSFRIPGPIRLPFVGTKWINYFIKMNKLHEYYADLNRQYGDVVLEQAGSVSVVSLFKRQDIEKVMKYPSKYPFRPPTELISFYRLSRPDRYASVGLVNAQGQEWAHLRSKLASKLLDNRKALTEFCPDLNKICDDFIKLMKTSRNENNVVDGVEDVLKSMAVESACRLILGRRTGLLNGTADKDERLHELTDAAKNIFKSCRDTFYGNGMWKFFPTKLYTNYVRNEELSYEIIHELIKKALRDDQLNQVDEENSSLLIKILKTEGLDMKDKISGVIDFISAGIELFSHTVSFLLYYLTICPEAQEKIYQETAHMGEELSHDDINRAFYTRAAIHEAFRLSPAAFAVARILEEDFYLSSYHLKAGTVVLCQNMVSSTKAENFQSPLEYKPERWLSSTGEFDSNLCVGSSIVLPFGNGRRICPGRKFILDELAILLIKLVRSFKIKYYSEFDRQFEFVLAPKAPVNVQFCDRM